MPLPSVADGLAGALSAGARVLATEREAVPSEPAVHGAGTLVAARVGGGAVGVVAALGAGLPGGRLEQVAESAARGVATLALDGRAHLVAVDGAAGARRRVDLRQAEAIAADHGRVEAERARVAGFSRTRRGARRGRPSHAQAVQADARVGRGAIAACVRSARAARRLRAQRVRAGVAARVWFVLRAAAVVGAAAGGEDERAGESAEREDRNRADGHAAAEGATASASCQLLRKMAGDFGWARVRHRREKLLRRSIADFCPKRSAKSRALRPA